VTKDQETPGARLALQMRRRGWSAPRLAEVAGGVSASSIRAYMADRTVPRPSQALALADGLGAVDGKALLEAWGYTDLAEGFYTQWREAVFPDDASIASRSEMMNRYNRIEYPGETLSDSAIQVVEALVSWMQHIEAAAETPGRPVRRRHAAFPIGEKP
jgi:transcriptional regulator with XRE-family HTH domain